MEDVLRPIREKIQQWIAYDENQPTVPYEGNEELYNTYRVQHDLDCKLTDGNLNADTIFSLWRPLRFTLARLNGYPKLNKIGDMNDKIAFLKELSKRDLSMFLPVDKPVVVKLAKLFELGMTRANVMILPHGAGMESINVLRNQEPFHDYMPYFLHECFEGGRFEQYFANDETLKEWICEQHLEMFFEGSNINKEKIRDLSGMEDYRKSIPLNMEVMLDNYIEILKQRQTFYPQCKGDDAYDFASARKC